MSQTCTALGLGLAFVATLLLNHLGSEAPSLPLWQKAAYFLAGGLGTVLVLRVLALQKERTADAFAPKRQDATDR